MAADRNGVVKQGIEEQDDRLCGGVLPVLAEIAKGYPGGICRFVQRYLRAQARDGVQVA